MYGQSSKAKDIRLLVQRLNADRGRCATNQDVACLNELACNVTDGFEADQSAAPRMDWSSFVQPVEVRTPHMIEFSVTKWGLG